MMNNKAIGYSINDSYRPYKRTEESNGSKPISTGKKVLLTALSIHYVLNTSGLNEQISIPKNEKSISIETNNKDGLSMTFNGKEFIMSTPLMKETFDQFEKRYEENHTQLLKNQEKTNTTLVEIKELLEGFVTKEGVESIIENRNNKIFKKSTLAILGAIGGVIAGIVGTLLTQFLTK